MQYRDVLIAKGGYPFYIAPNVVPGSDGAGTVVAVGKHVTRFKAGDRVVTLFNQGHLGGPIDLVSRETGLGGMIDGTFREFAAFNEQGLVPLPSSLSFIEGASLTCAGLTAWNALFGDQKFVAGQYVLTQGTGGVSIFAVQFAKAAGAKVIATTSSEHKAALLRKLGADHIINYKDTPEWGAAARALTPNGAGVDRIVEVAGLKSMVQSLEAIKLEGVINIVGFVGAAEAPEKEPNFLQCLVNCCTARGVNIGSRLQMEEMCRAIEANPEALKPVVDQKVFKLDQLKEAYAYLLSGEHQGKVGITIE